MTDTPAAVDDFLEARARQAPAAAPASASEIWDANWQEAGLHTMGAGAVYGQARADIVNAIEAAAGKPLGDYARQQGITLGAAGTPDENIGELANVAATLPEDARKHIEPLLDWRRNAESKAAAIERTAADVNANTYGLSANAVRLAAGIARQAVDPLNVAAMAVTAPIGGEGTLPLLQVFARQAAAAGAAQLLQEPIIQSTRAGLGLSSGFEDAAGDVVGAAAGGGAIGGGLTGLLRGGAWALRLARRGLAIERPENSSPMLRSAAEPLGESASPIAGHAEIPLAPADLDAAAHLAERDQAIEASAPAGVDQVDHGQRVADAANMLESGRLPPTMERLSELQLGEIAGHVNQLETTAAAARGELDSALGKISDRQADLTARSAELEPLRQQVTGLQADLADAQQRLAAVRGPTDPETQGRLSAIESELAQANLPARRRGELAAEQASIAETLAATGPQDARQAASIQQEVDGLTRALERNQKSLNKGQGAIDKLAARTADRQQSITQRRADLDARLASQKQIVANELRRSIARLSADGYGVRLTHGEAETFAEHVLAARPEDLPGALRDVTQELVNRRVADTGLMPQREMPPAISDMPLPSELRFVQRVTQAIAELGAESKFGEAFVARVQKAIAGFGEKKTADGAAFVERVQRAIAELQEKPADGAAFIERVQQAIAELGDNKQGDTFVRNVQQAIAELKNEKSEPAPATVKAKGRPAAKPEEPAAAPREAAGEQAPAAAAGETKLGDPALAADAERVLEEAGGDFKIVLDENGGAVSAREALALAEEDATAARELADCAAMEAAE